jgi:glucuronokinase
VKRVRREAYARAGLLGNPSDLYDGRVIALALANFRASVAIEHAASFEIVPGADDRLAFPSLREAAAALDAYGCEDGVRLLRASLRKVVELRGGLGDVPAGDPHLAFRISYETDIPRQVGLSGSSAIITAALRALCDWFGLALAPAELAEATLACEADELGITAGPMDRVIQAYEGLVYMDFTKPRSAASYRRLDAGRLPPLFVAWDRSGGAPSRKLHGDVRARYLRGDTEVRQAMAALPELADRGLRCLETGDFAVLRELIDRNFEIRASVYPLPDADRRLVRIARDAGAAAKLCGSGGAVIGALADDARWPALASAFAAAGFGAQRIRVAEPADGRGPSTGGPDR